MNIFAWIVITGSLFCAGWYARGLWNAIDESQVGSESLGHIYDSNLWRKSQEDLD